MTDPAGYADDLADWCRHWSRQWWDAEAHLVHNPAGSFGPLVPARSVHLTPQSAWVAYGLLGSSDPADHREADSAIGALLDLQYDAPGRVFHGTFARFPEAPYPPDQPVMWEDYDPNWRQFVGTAFALIIEDHGALLSADRQAAMLAAIALACAGEAAEDRLRPSYANPALMQAWLDAWCGRRLGDEAQIDRGQQLAARVVERFDRFGAFDEFNSPTYYGIDLYALALWRAFPPTGRFADDGARLEEAIWHEAASFYHAGLNNYCGPYTRSYGPDATRTVTLIALWMWAAFGRPAAPLPDLTAEVIDHGHDLMAGPVIGRLARLPPAADRASFVRFDGDRQIRHELPTGRVVTAALFADLMLGAEESEHDWNEWTQFMPAVAHWLEADGPGVLWLTAVRRLWGSVDGRRLTLEVQRPGGPASIELHVAVPSCAVEGADICTENVRITVEGDPVTIRAEGLGDRLHRVMIEPAVDVDVLQCVLAFAVGAPAGTVHQPHPAPAS